MLLMQLERSQVLKQVLKLAEMDLIIFYGIITRVE